MINRLAAPTTSYYTQYVSACRRYTVHFDLIYLCSITRGYYCFFYFFFFILPTHTRRPPVIDVSFATGNICATGVVGMRVT